jgi:hypothetical protein
VSARAALILVLAVLAAGCGGGGSDGELAKRADPVCARANAALAALERPESLEQLLRYVEEASQIVEKRRADLAAIKPSGDEAESWKAFLEANDRAIAALVRVRESTVTGRGGDEAIREFETAEADARRLADELGLRECALVPPQPVEEEPEPATTTSATPPAPPTWTARADAICGAAQGRIDALPQPTDPLSAASQAAQVSAIVKQEIADLRRLEPPPRQKARVNRFLDALGRGVNSLDRLVQAMTDQDEDAVDRFIGEAEKAAEQAQREADALGLTVCGRG